MTRSIEKLFTFAALTAAMCIPAMSANRMTAPPPTPPVTSLLPAAPLGPQSYLVAQSGDATFRINELEEQVRKLNGKVEELTFQLLELQETLRKMQEDNELRFQELEDQKQGSVSGTSDTKTADVPEPKANRLEKPDASETQSASDATTRTDLPKVGDTQSSGLAAPARSLGTIKFDDSGNVIDSGPAPSDQSSAKSGGLPPGVFDDGTEGAVEAAEFGPTPDSVLAVGKRALEGNRFDRASRAFKAHLKAWPKDPRGGEVRYHLGQVLFQKKDYYNAANLFLDTHNTYPDAHTGADNLLSLGLSLAGLNQREVACATYAEVLKQYPKDQKRLKARVTAEQASARC